MPARTSAVIALAHRVSTSSGQKRRSAPAGMVESAAAAAGPASAWSIEPTSPRSSHSSASDTPSATAERRAGGSRDRGMDPGQEAGEELHVVLEDQVVGRVPAHGRPGDPGRLQR